MKHVVGVADMKTSKQPEDELITHGLGSCLGVAVYDPVAKVGGMLHAMMPDSSINPDKAKANPGMFVDSGVPTLFAGIERDGGLRSRCKLKIAGGALINGTNDYFETGRRNYVALKRMLWKCGMLIDAEDIGGNDARTMRLEIKSGQVRMTKKGVDYYL